MKKRRILALLLCLSPAAAMATAPYHRVFSRNGVMVWTVSRPDIADPVTVQLTDKAGCRVSVKHLDIEAFADTVKLGLDDPGVLYVHPSGFSSVSAPNANLVTTMRIGGGCTALVNVESPHETDRFLDALYGAAW